MRDNKRLDMIKALLSKTTDNGCSEEEAASAYAKAVELMEKYNIDEARVASHQTTKKKKNWVTVCVWSGKGKSWEMPFVVEIIRRYFFVESYYSGSHMYGSESIWVFGEAENCENAQFVFNQLCFTFKSLWQARRKSRGYNQSYTRTYYAGLKVGFTEKILEEREAREKVDPTIETMLAVITNEIQVALNEEIPNLTAKAESAPLTGGRGVYEMGRRDGAEINLNKPVGSSSYRGIK